MKNILFVIAERSYMLIMAFFLFSGLGMCYGQEVAQWRGVDRNGIYNETDLLDEWPAQGPDLLWVYEGIGKGYASPSVTEDRVFVNGEEDGDGFLYAFDLEGQLLWKSPNGKEFVGSGLSGTYPGARSTPTVMDDLVYTTSGRGRIACFDVSTGAEKWAVDKNQHLGGLENEFGYSESLVVDDDKVYCFPGGNETNMAALDRLTGEIIWTARVLLDTFSYCSPILVKMPTRKILITTSRHHLYAVDCEQGQLLGSYELEGFKWDGEHCNTPIYDTGYIYFIGNDDTGKGAIKLELKENGESIKEVWYNRRIRNNFGGFVKVHNLLFTTLKGKWLKALELENGTVVDSLKIADGSLIYADNKFICYGTTGNVNLVNYKENKLKVSGTFKITQGTGHHFSHPVIAKGVMYIRHGNALMAYKIK